MGSTRKGCRPGTEPPPSFPLHPLQELGFLCLFIHLVSTASPSADPFKVPANIQEKLIGLLCLPFCSELTAVMLCRRGSSHSQPGLQHSCVAIRRRESRGQTRLTGYPTSGKETAQKAIRKFAKDEILISQLGLRCHSRALSPLHTAGSNPALLSTVRPPRAALFGFVVLKMWESKRQRAKLNSSYCKFPKHLCKRFSFNNKTVFPISSPVSPQIGRSAGPRSAPCGSRSHRAPRRAAERPEPLREIAAPRRALRV